ncbi:MAG: tRNA (adenosine(37)-N6)-threonylcarbamoyltransferase complex transferase subunit TsaD [Alphaproteobacteria bacterium]|nr:tRNA (adenosine(37)-N6)-threonylcarbamoyltransferase complex transferase subunit TsaD [Alphaproteobacteria bacterium]
MNILGIETSCDEAGVALVDSKGAILAQGLASHAELCVPHGGILPEVIAREHVRVLPPLVKHTLETQNYSWRDIDAVAVTEGPGLISSLLIGCAYARGLSRALGCPLYGVHHLQAHVLIARMQAELEYPFVALLISGGHTTLYNVVAPNQLIDVGSTQDDAVGEAFDKVARLLGFPYPGGVHIERIARQGKPSIPFPKPMIHTDNLNFSFSGLKAAVARYVEQSEMTDALRADIACSFQESVASVLAVKVRKCLQQQPLARSVVMTGGVAANKRLREVMRVTLPDSIKVVAPEPKLCTDNGVMTAWAAYELHKHGLLEERDVLANPNLHMR